MASILDEIVLHKREEIARAKAQISENALLALSKEQSAPRGFMQALAKKAFSQQAAVIAEIKKASPSAGVIRADFDASAIAKDYAAHGATCLSVLTDKRFFQGAEENLRAARAACALPVLRKDFMLEEYQVVEARAWGADCILLIAAILDDARMQALFAAAEDLGMDTLVEVHDEKELERALRLPVRAVGVNNRNLHDFSISLATSARLKALLPEDYFLIAESGIHTPKDIAELQAAGIYAYLIGGALMREKSPGQALSELLGG